ncbi:integrase core domain-containing protein [Mesorhizobium sp. M0207]|uniref:integrase core domain-containing protein n=1 Tax=Mesorhizobium sp. M0207 TaxID=2956915 RepID=UPI00333C4158
MGKTWREAKRPPFRMLIATSKSRVLRPPFECAQYACAEYAARLAAHRIQPSMSRIGNPYDNAKAERFMRTLKDEEVDGRDYRDIIDAKKSIGEFIERAYNRQRLHSALDYLLPDEYEAGLTRLRQGPLAAIQNLENCPY